MTHLPQQPDTSAEEARFSAFIEGTAQDEREWIAFLEFERAIDNAAMCAAMINPYDGGEQGGREHAGLKLVLGGMFFRVLPRVDLGVLIAEAEGVGYALRYGIIESKPDALDAIADTDAFRALAGKGFAAEQADSDQRVAAMAVRHEDSES